MTKNNNLQGKTCTLKEKTISKNCFYYLQVGYNAVVRQTLLLNQDYREQSFESEIISPSKVHIL